MRCNCEHADCFTEHAAKPCPNDAGTVRIDMLGLVCDECAPGYGAPGEWPRLDTGPVDAEHRARLVAAAGWLTNLARPDSARLRAASRERANPDDPTAQAGAAVDVIASLEWVNDEWPAYADDDEPESVPSPVPGALASPDDRAAAGERVWICRGCGQGITGQQIDKGQLCACGGRKFDRADHPTRDYYNESGERQRCPDCGRFTFYDESESRYRHVTEPDRGCFLISAEAVANA